ncbi:MAG: hypothetical protein BWY79_02147 [Actinobacteria bacterium ADurb.Bin444]|nr:MAG: hypothetical protein BWY79_02147 [Actinobacteria bacterium ADurb.Bin444]
MNGQDTPAQDSDMVIEEGLEADPEVPQQAEEIAPAETPIEASGQPPAEPICTPTGKAQEPESTRVPQAPEVITWRPFPKTELPKAFAPRHLP